MNLTYIADVSSDLCSAASDGFVLMSSDKNYLVMTQKVDTCQKVVSGEIREGGEKERNRGGTRDSDRREKIDYCTNVRLPPLLTD